MQTRRNFMKGFGLAVLTLVATPSLLLHKKHKIERIEWQSWEEEGVIIVNARALAKLELDYIPITFRVDGVKVAECSQLSVCQFHPKEPIFTLPRQFRT